MSFLTQAQEAINAVGGRMTAQRRLIIELLEHADTHLDAEGLYDLARQHDADVSLATVYRTLNVLEAAGLLQQRYLSRDHERKYYEPIHAAAQYHFTCRQCGRVIPFESHLVGEIRRVLEATLGVQVDHACACFDGLCPACLQGA